MSKVLNTNKLLEVISSITERIEKELIKANRMGRLDEVLEKYGFECEGKYGYCEPRVCKILVIGQSSINKEVFNSVLKKYEISKDRLEYVLEYDEAKNFRMDTLRNNFKYSDIFVGPIPHKTVGMGDCSSIIADIEQNQSEYPKLTKLIASGELKITKSNFEDALVKSELYNNYL